MNYPTINSFDFLCGYSTGNSKFSHGLETNLEINDKFLFFTRSLNGRKNYSDCNWQSLFYEIVFLS